MTSVIVFGPTGNVASVAALTAHENGAKVYLAMRDPKKTIPGLSAEKEKTGGFERVQADLTKPDTVAAAVKSSGAKRAFIYLAWGTPDHMKGSIQALKSAGIEYVVFLSSGSVGDDPRSITPDKSIPYSHGQVDINLEDVFGSENYVAVQPGAFATNLLQIKGGILAGDVKIFAADVEFDYITSEDMGSVSGTLLVHGTKNGQKVVHLSGPNQISQRHAIQSIAKAIGKNVKITEISAEEGLEQWLSHGVPRPAAEYMINLLSESSKGNHWELSKSKTGAENIKLYTGRPATTLPEWLEANKALFM